MTNLQILKAFLQQATASGSRSTVLKDLLWVIGIVISAILIASKFGLPIPLITALFVIFCLLIAIFLFSYIFCLVKNPDWLRSEKFSIEKMAIEKGFVGDSTVGVITESRNTRGHILEAPVEEAGDESQ